MEELRGLELIEEGRALCVEERVRKAKVLSDLESSTLLEEMSWRQESKALWLREGDKYMEGISNKKLPHTHQFPPPSYF